MEVSELLDTLEEIVRQSKQVPFSKKVMVDPDDILSIIQEIIQVMPDELKKAQWITEERSRILQEAKKEADDIVKEAEKRIIELVDEHEITRQAEQKSLKIIEDAKMQSRQITEGTKDYVDSKLAEAERSLLELLSKMQMQQENLSNTIDNLKEDRRGLKR